RCGGPTGAEVSRTLPASRLRPLGNDDSRAPRMGRKGRGHRTEQLTEETAAAPGADDKRLRPGAELGEHSGRAALCRQKRHFARVVVQMLPSDIEELVSPIPVGPKIGRAYV